MTTVERPSERIGERVAFYRKLNGMSAADLSEATGGAISKGVIANIETGRKKDLTVDELISISWALGVPPLVIALPIDRPDTFIRVASDDADLTLIRVDLAAREFVQPAIPWKADSAGYSRPSGPARALAFSQANSIFQWRKAAEDLSLQKRKTRIARQSGDEAEIRLHETVLADAERVVKLAAQQLRTFGLQHSEDGEHPEAHGREGLEDDETNRRLTRRERQIKNNPDKGEEEASLG